MVGKGISLIKGTTCLWMYLFLNEIEVQKNWCDNIPIKSVTRFNKDFLKDRTVALIFIMKTYSS